LKFQETPLRDAWVVDIAPIEDERGFFARSFCGREFSEHGLNPRVVQCNVSFNRRRGTLRGMHYQAAPHEEAKLVRCTQGAVWDVMVDLRPASPTFKRWHGVELSAANRRAFYVPEGVAHGFQTLSEDAEVLYQMTAAFVPEAARGVRWNDPAFAIRWPIADPFMSERDRAFPLFAG
jgi:dTDP-4-dehydrorhamnose 3,5-epimerase